MKPYIGISRNTLLPRLLMFLVVFSLFLLPFCASAQEDHERVARNFLAFKHARARISSSRILESSIIEPSLPSVPIAYLADLEEGGFILVSWSRDRTPIKAYSLEGDFDTLPAGYREFLLCEMAYDARAAQETARARMKSSYADINQKRWDFLLDYDGTRRLKPYAPGTYLVTTQWHQKPPYNRFLPEMNGKRVVAGCVGVALAQIMRYYRYPDSGSGVVSYTWQGSQLKAVLYRDYHWGHMPETIGMLTPEHEADEIARLIRDVAYAHETEFGIDTSTAIVNVAALTKNFGYSTEIDTLKNTDSDLFFEAIQEEIDANHPVLLRFPGHMGIADGYSSDESGRSIHINFGWDGTDDEFYFLDQNIVTTNHVYPPGELMIYRSVKPCSGDDCYTNLETGDRLEDPNIFGRFDAAKDADEYGLYLKGATTITGTRYYYSNQAFYISLYDSRNNVVASDDDPLSLTLPADHYTLKASLCAGIWCYKADDGHLDYAISIGTDALTEEERAAIDANCDIPPLIMNDFRNIIVNSCGPPFMILIDAVDENGDEVTVTAETGSNEVSASIDADDILSITPAYGMSKMAVRINVSATANDTTAEKSFIALVMDEDISFGREFEIAGTLSDQNSLNTHTVILDGPCTISGECGLSGRTLFMGVTDPNGNDMADPNYGEVQADLARGIYAITASFWQDPNILSMDPVPYRITVLCPDAYDSIAATARMLDIDLSSLIPEGVGQGRQYAAIQEAIDCAEDGDTITVYPGTFHENIDFPGRAITVRSAHGPSVTIIDGSAAGSVVRFAGGEDSDTILRGFTLRNGKAERGAGILCLGSSPSIINCFLQNNTADVEGGGIYDDGGGMGIIRCLFKGNTSNGIPNQVSIERNSITYHDAEILFIKEDIVKHVLVLDPGRHRWSARYPFFGKVCGKHPPYGAESSMCITRLPDFQDGS
ncbi:MAG: C10 family peptidase [bacterium]